MNIRRKSWLVCLPLALSAGCAATMPDRAARMERGYVYYLDGAGGGMVWSNWSGGVRKGMIDGGYDGAGEMFSWQTGLGVAADQVASNELKRGKARDLAREITKYQSQRPHVPVTLIGLSAGTAIAVFALDALPNGASVDNVVLLSGSLSADFDLTQALRRVNGRVYVFTSQRDPVLMVMLPLAGTADRGADTNATIGVEGVKLPRGATAETRRIYAEKVVVVPRNEEFAAAGDRGGHIDAVRAPFIERFVAPLVRTTSATYATTAGAAIPAGKVANPDFARWASFAPGSWAELEGERIVGGKRQPIRVRATLQSKSTTSLVVKREIVGANDIDALPEFPRVLFLTAAIDRDAHPMTHPQSRIDKLPSETVLVAGQSLPCDVKRVVSPVDSPVWGRNVKGTAYTNASVPGGIVRIDIETMLEGRPTHLEARLCSYDAKQK